MCQVLHQREFRDTVFTQLGNLPINRDGIALFKSLTSFASVSSMQLPFFSFNTILEYSLLHLDFDISKINTKLSHLFILATTQHRKLDELERIQHTLSLYSKVI